MASMILSNPFKPIQSHPVPLKTLGFAFLLLAAWPQISPGQDVLLFDSIVTSPTGDATNGIYKGGPTVGLNDTNNLAVAGGSIVGFKATEPWSVNSGLIRSLSAGVSSASLLSTAGGSVGMAGADDATLRYAIRGYSTGYAPVLTNYFTVSFNANYLDDNAVSLAAFTDTTSTSRTTAIAANTGTFYRGLAVGLKGNGSGGMDAILRFRNNSMTYVDQVLLADISANTTYTFAGKIAWNVSTSSGATTGTLDRDLLSLWLNPTSDLETTTPTFSALGEQGDNATANVLDTLHLMQQNYGRNSSDIVSIDEFRVGTTAADLSLVPEPSSACLAGWGLAGLLLAIRRRR